jgi:hypothetical protein
VCRHAAVRIVKGETQAIVVDEPDLEGILGPARYESEVAQRTAVSGVSTGLAWTQAGGEILFVEASVHRSGGRGGGRSGANAGGSGMRLQLTGQLGKVMEESVRAALSFVRANLAQVLVAGLERQRRDHRQQQEGGTETSQSQSDVKEPLKEPLFGVDENEKRYLGMTIEEWENHVDSLSLVSTKYRPLVYYSLCLCLWFRIESCSIGENM